MKVHELMTRDVITVDADATVAQVVRLMLENHVSGLPVLDDAGYMIGILTEIDVVAKHARVHLPRYIQILGGILPIGARETDREIRHALASTARELMTPDVVTVTPETDVDDAASLMADEQLNPLPVLEDDILVGIVSHADIMRLLLLEEQDERE
jgi:CBS domain-containing protein